MNKFSIILPVRNGGEHVKICIKSILAQTITDFDLLVLDNNSTDGTLEWVQTLSDKRIFVYPSAKSLTIEENWGRIKDIKKNEFITLIGHDDVLLPEYLKEMNALIQKHPNASLYQAHFSFIDTSGKFLRNCQPMDEMQYGHEFLACQFARTLDSMGTGYMMRSRDYDDLGGMPVHYPNLIFADYQLWVQLSLKNYKATTPEFCFQYRLHNSVSKMTNGERYLHAFGMYIDFLFALRKENEAVREVIGKYASEFLMFHCESLSHRLLKIPINERTLKVSDFIAKCKEYASRLIPGQPFEPSNKFRIGLAEKLDNSGVGRSAFHLFKKISRS